VILNACPRTNAYYDRVVAASVSSLDHQRPPSLAQYNRSGNEDQARARAANAAGDGLDRRAVT
jgi:hypothetical protein